MDDDVAPQTRGEADQPLDGELSEPAAHQGGDLRLVDAEAPGGLNLRELRGPDQATDLVCQLGLGKAVAGVGKPEVGEDVCAGGADLYVRRRELFSPGGLRAHISARNVPRRLSTAFGPGPVPRAVSGCPSWIS